MYWVVNRSELSLPVSFILVSFILYLFIISTTYIMKKGSVDKRSLFLHKWDGCHWLPLRVQGVGGFWGGRGWAIRMPGHPLEVIVPLLLCSSVFLQETSIRTPLIVSLVAYCMGSPRSFCLATQYNDRSNSIGWRLETKGIVAVAVM